MEKLLTLKEVTEAICLSYQTLNRLMSAGTFPQPVNGRRRKLLWTQSSIEEWMNRNATLQPATAPIRPSKRRQQDKDYRSRQEAAAKALERHRKSK